MKRSIYFLLTVTLASTLFTNINASDLREIVKAKTKAKYTNIFTTVETVHRIWVNAFKHKAAGRKIESRESQKILNSFEISLQSLMLQFNNPGISIENKIESFEKFSNYLDLYIKYAIDLDYDGLFRKLAFSALNMILNDLLIKGIPLDLSKLESQLNKDRIGGGFKDPEIIELLNSIFLLNNELIAEVEESTASDTSEETTTS